MARTGLVARFDFVRSLSHERIDNRHLLLGASPRGPPLRTPSWPTSSAGIMDSRVARILGAAYGLKFSMVPATHIAPSSGEALM